MNINSKLSSQTSHTSTTAVLYCSQNIWSSYSAWIAKIWIGFTCLYLWQTVLVAAPYNVCQDVGMTSRLFGKRSVQLHTTTAMPLISLRHISISEYWLLVYFMIVTNSRIFAKKLKLYFMEITALLSDCRTFPTLYINFARNPFSM